MTSARRTDPRLALAGIILFAVAIRFVDIGARLHVDDAYSWLVASAGSPHAFLHQLAASENTPPLFYLLLAPLPIGQEAWLRIPAAVPGVLMCVVLYYAVSRPLGDRAALFATLAVAVDPFLVTYADVARGFMLADLALLTAFWAVLRLIDGGSLRWAIVYLATAVVALYTEYDSAIFLVALTVSALGIGNANRPKLAALGILPLLSLVPWIPQLIRGQHAVDLTKLAPTFPAPSLTAFRDAAVTLTLGESGGTSSDLGRWLELGVILTAGGLALFALSHSWKARTRSSRRVVLLIGASTGLTLFGHAVASAFGFDLFNQRYLTLMVPLVAALGAAGIASLGSRALLLAASSVLALLGVVGLVKRYHHQYEPDLAPVRLYALQSHPRTVLTNSPVVLYYLPSLRVQLDRPNDLGSGRARTCTRPCLVVDDSRVRGGPARDRVGTRRTVGPYVLTLER